MSSHKSIPKVVLAPSRLRGRERVASIMDAAASVFAEKGYEAATMTEIAQRASTAIGSLYRFFPTKALLANALFARYSDAILARLDHVASMAGALDPFELADALLALMLAQRLDRDAAVELADMRDDDDAWRSDLRRAVRERLGVILVGAGLPRERAARMAPVVLQAMKALHALTREGMDENDAMRELRIMIGVYLDAGRSHRRR